MRRGLDDHSGRGRDLLRPGDGRADAPGVLLRDLGDLRVSMHPVRRMCRCVLVIMTGGGKREETDAEKQRNSLGDAFFH